MTTPPIWVFGDSIVAGTWLASISDCWVSRMATRIGGDSCTSVTNHGVGGLALHNPDGTTNGTLMPVLQAALNTNPAPATVIVAIGTNDLVTHDTTSPPSSSTSLDQSMQAAIQVDLVLQSAGVKNRFWSTILPMGYGSAHSDTWLPILLQRRTAFNTWMRAQWVPPNSQLIDLDGVLQEDSTGLVTAPYLLDGLHPNQWGAVRVSDAMPIGGLI